MVLLERVGFAAPGAGQRPRVRWWWPGGAVTKEGIERELRAIRAAGFARAEIALLPMGLPAEVDGDTVKTWGTSRFTEHLEQALTAARELGLRLDLTVSPGWPFASPAVGGDRIGLAQQKLVRGYRELAAGNVIDGAVPAPEGDATQADRLIAVTAARRSDAVPAPTGPILLDPESAVDLTDRVVAGKVRWTAPSTGRWLVFAFWSRPSGQRSLAEAGPQDAPVVDHFSADALAAATDHIDRHVLPARLDALLRAAGGDVFEDSLELAVDGELWTASFLAEFARRRGYDLTRYLPVLRIDRLYRFDWATLLDGIDPESPAVHDFPGGLGRRVRHDYYQTLNELYVDNHVEPLTRWANGRGLRYRAQPYGNTMDHVEVAGSVQVPESEDLVNWLAAGGMTDGAAAYDLAVDFHRGIAAGAHMRGGAVVSLESCAVLGADYQTDLAALKRHVDVAFCGGVNQLVLHGFPYQDVAEAAWPGWAPFSADGTPEVSDAWGPRQPMWRHMRAFADYVARAATILQCGRPRVDVAIYRQAYWCLAWPKFTAGNLADAGYTYEFLSPNLLALDAAVVRDGRLAPDHAAYRALVIDNEEAMDPSVLARLRSMSDQGLPVVVVGAGPGRAPSFLDAADTDREVQRLVAELLSLPNVRQVDDQRYVPDALRALGVQPDARLRDSTNVLSVHRVGPDGDYYYLFNMGTARSTFSADLRGSGAARVLDLWNGTSHPVAPDTAEDRHRLVLELGPEESTVVFLGRGPGLDAEPVSVLAPATPVQQRWSRELAHWDLHVEDWRPAGTTERRLTLTALDDWRRIPDLAEVAGVGTYRSTVSLEPGWDDGVDAVLLDLGRVAGSVRVEVNGQLAAGDCVAARALNVQPFLLVGANSVQVEIATTLGNRLIALGKAGEADYARFAARSPQPAGLIGPVRLCGVTASG
nr:Arm21 [uncultured bacterium]